MADETKPAIGMSVGVTALAAVTADRAVSRRPVLTLYPDRSCQIGAPEENPEADESGLVITDFVDRVGDPEPVVASDGSTHRPAQLLAEGLQALAYVATEGLPLPQAVAVAYPAHWAAAAVDALRDALSQVPEWSTHPVSLTSDIAAALTALQASPGLPDSGIIAVCDFGGSGTNITLVDAAHDYQPVGTTIRYTGFSGEVIDQALLDHVVADLRASGSLDSAVGTGSLARLHAQCRTAKEQLSVNTVIELPGFHAAAWLTRAELDNAIRQPLDSLFDALQRVLDDNGIEPTDLTAIAAFGGGASIPAITTGLAERFGVAVISSPRPHLTGAIGAALGVAGGPAGTVAVPSAAPPVSPGPPVPAVTPAAPVTPVPAVTPAAPGPPVASVPESTPTVPEPVAPQEIPIVAPPVPPVAPLAQHPASVEITEPEPEPTVEYEPGEPRRAGVAWYRRPVPVILVAALAALIMATVAVIALRHAADRTPEPSTVPARTTTTTFEPPRQGSPTPESTQPVFPGVPTLPPVPETIPPMSEVPETPEGQ